MTSRQDVLTGIDDLADAVDQGAQVLDVRWSLGEAPGTGRRQYEEAHLPGALFLDLEAVLTGPCDDPSKGRHPLPDAARLAAGLGALGVDPARPIVVYDEPGSFAAGRAWWVLRWAGLDVRVLDGGIRAWLAAGRPTQDGAAPTPPATAFDLVTGQVPTVTADQVAAAGGVLIDVRAPERYRGEAEPIDQRAGHIPGALNRPVGRLWDDSGRLLDEARLREILDLPVGSESEIVVYCGSGVSAAQAILALASLGIDAALYPPSWSGWSSDPTRPAATGDRP